MLTARHRTALLNCMDTEAPTQEDWSIVSSLVSRALAYDEEHLVSRHRGIGRCVVSFVPVGEEDEPSLIVLVDRTYHVHKVLIVKDLAEAGQEFWHITNYAVSAAGQGDCLPKDVDEAVLQWLREQGLNRLALMAAGRCENCGSDCGDI